MAPSVDGVGRRFPIMVARRGVDAAAVAAVSAAAEAAIYAALSEAWSADRLAEVVAMATPMAEDEWTSAPGWWTVDEHGGVVARVDGARPPALMRHVLGMGAQGGAWA